MSRSRYVRSAATAWSPATLGPGAATAQCAGLGPVAFALRPTAPRPFDEKAERYAYRIPVRNYVEKTIANAGMGPIREARPRKSAGGGTCSRAAEKGRRLFPGGPKNAFKPRPGAPVRKTAPRADRRIFAAPERALEDPEWGPECPEGPREQHWFRRNGLPSPGRLFPGPARWPP